MKSLAITYDLFGDPEQVLRVAEVDVPDNLRIGEVLIKQLASPVHPSDIGMISGRYGNLPVLPAVAGREGVGEIVKVGNGCKSIVGQVVKMPFGTWRSFVVAREEDLFFVPPGVDVHQASMAFVNPSTAWMLLRNIRELRTGDWIIQNAANSAVGVAVIAIAQFLKINTINLVRRARERQDKLLSCGATLVFEDETFDPKSLKNYTGGLLPVFGINSIGGNSVLKIIKSMESGGEVVTIGGMVSDHMRFPTRELIFNDVKLRGFWLDKFVKSQSHDRLQGLFDEIFGLISSKVINLPIDSIVSLSAGPKAIIEAYKNASSGKVLIVS